MATNNKRLSGSDRGIIKDFAKRQIEATADTAAVDAAYEAAADAIHGVVVAHWPQKDMRVLQRYGSASDDACIYVSAGDTRYERFCYRDGDKRIALRPNRSCNRQPVLLEGDAEKAFNAFQAATKAADQDKERRRRDFAALIEGTLTFNALVEVWPALEALRTTICGSKSAVQVLSADVVSRIQNDAAFTAEVAA